MPTIKMTKQEAVDLNNGLHVVGGLSGVKFAYAVARNIEALKPEMKAFRKASEWSEAVVAYDEEREELAKKHADKDQRNKPMTYRNPGENRDRFVIKDVDVFEKELEKLKKKHAPALEEKEKQDEAVRELLKEDVEINVYEIFEEDLPENITGQQLSGILPVVDVSS